MDAPNYENRYAMPPSMEDEAADYAEAKAEAELNRITAKLESHRFQLDCLTPLERETLNQWNAACS